MCAVMRDVSLSIGVASLSIVVNVTADIASLATGVVLTSSV